MHNSWLLRRAWLKKKRTQKLQSGRVTSQKQVRHQASPHVDEERVAIGLNCIRCGLPLQIAASAAPGSGYRTKCWFSRTFRAQQYDDTRVTSPDRTLEDPKHGSAIVGSHSRTISPRAWLHRLLGDPRGSNPQGAAGRRGKRDRRNRLCGAVESPPTAASGPFCADDVIIFHVGADA